MARVRPSNFPVVMLRGAAIASRRGTAVTTYPLPPERLRPVIRIAHHIRSVLWIPDRLILDHELVFIEDGRGTLHVGAERFAFGPGDLLFIPPFQPHRFESPPKPGAHVAIHFDLAPNLPPYASNLPRRSPYAVRLGEGLEFPRFVASVAADVAAEIRAIPAHFARPDAASRLRAEAGLLWVLAALLQRRGTEPGKSPAREAGRARIGKAVEFLRGRLAERVTPADLAAAAGLSPSHFARLFRMWMGMAPAEFILRQRLELARRLLGDVDLSIKEVAARCGFEDAYYFSKVFRRFDGLPPTHFRESILAGKSRE